MFGSTPVSILGRIARRLPARATSGEETASEPWYRNRPRIAAAVIAGSALAVLGLQLLDHRASDAIALLYVLPVSLAAVTFGLRGGLVGAFGGYLAFAVFAVVTRSGHVGLDGWISRGVALFLLGALLGQAADRTAQANRRTLGQVWKKLVTEEENRRYREGMELSDSILQYVAAARWAIEQGDPVEADRLLRQALVAGQALVGELLPPTTNPPTANRP